MFYIGDEFTIESYRIPWLIWIQLVVLFLLLALLFFFALFPSDPDDSAATVTAVPTTASSSLNPFIFDDIHQIHKPRANRRSTSSLVIATNGQQHLEQGGRSLSIKGEIETDSSMIREEITEAEASTLNSHIWHYVQLATIAFLKCFGLDSTSDSPPTRKHRKRKES